MTRSVLLIALCLLAACDSGDLAAPDGDVPLSEAKAVQEAAEMIPSPQAAASPRLAPRE